MIKYYSIINEDKKVDISKLNKLYNKIKQKTEEQNRNSLNEILQDARNNIGIDVAEVLHNQLIMRTREDYNQFIDDKNDDFY